MKSFFALLTVMAFAVPSRMQQSDATTQSGVPIVAIGCVNRATSNGSLAGTAAVAPATPETAGTLANSTESTSSFMLNGATQPDASDEARALASADHRSAAAEVAYVLDGTRSELELHAGHRVEVTGTLSASNTNGGPDASAGMQSNVRHIQVASIRMIATACTMASPDRR